MIPALSIVVCVVLLAVVCIEIGGRLAVSRKVSPGIHLDLSETPITCHHERLEFFEGKPFLIPCPYGCNETVEPDPYPARF